ncbi:gag_pre-integrs domain-containing protein [Nephila pilipes]|uniref:Gag_pre-integrs domain-containing protein n=1 Tax=Nephila pilipes TaxID=299642 RepID=A0A8X6MP07_NEPPI|nr:gag_pre-integrs domain-containing protein [Nephila pilipes]
MLERKLVKDSTKTTQEALIATKSERLRAEKCWLKVDGGVVLYGSRNLNGSLFKASIEPILPKEVTEVHTAVADCSLLQLYHERRGHQDKRLIKNMLQKELST